MFPVTTLTSSGMDTYPASFVKAEKNGVENAFFRILPLRYINSKHGQSCSTKLFKLQLRVTMHLSHRAVKEIHCNNELKQLHCVRHMVSTQYPATTTIYQHMIVVCCICTCTSKNHINPIQRKEGY